MTKTTGHCLCGQLSFQTNATPLWTSHCHCDSCRRACAAPITSFIGFDFKVVEWSGARQFYISPQGRKRGFCPNCGTQMCFESPRWPNEIHLYAATLDAPENYVAQMHSHWGEKLSWCAWEDNLDKLEAGAESLTE